MYGWKLGLKTGMYYLRTNSQVAAKQSLGVDTVKEEFPIIKEVVVKNTYVEEDVNRPMSEISEEDALKALTCSIDNPDDCEMCSG